MRLRRFVVRTMEASCAVADRLPFGLGYRTRLGCPRGLALWAITLDERWGTDAWPDIEPMEDDADV
jgi:hypothetical protein